MYHWSMDVATSNDLMRMFLDGREYFSEIPVDQLREPVQTQPSEQEQEQPQPQPQVEQDTTHATQQPQQPQQQQQQQQQQEQQQQDTLLHQTSPDSSPDSSARSSARSSAVGSDTHSDTTLPDEAHDTLSSVEDQPATKHQHPDRIDLIARQTWTDTKETIILGPYDYIASEPGKDFRGLLLNSFNAWLDIPPESLRIITNVVRMLHTSSLLIDDIQDNSTLRRGKPVAHNIFGVAQTINAGNYVYFQALNELAQLQNPAAAMQIYTTEMLYLHRGQGMDLHWRDTLTCPTEEEYLEMASNKTGGLFRLAVKLMQSESPTSIDCMPLVNLLGLIYQIADDHKNLSDIHYAQKKGTAEDLTEGKFSFPIIHSINADPNNKELLNILARKPTDIHIKKRAVDYMENTTRSLDYAKGWVDTLLARADVAVEEIDQGRGKSEGMKMLLKKLQL